MRRIAFVAQLLRKQCAVCCLFHFWPFLCKWKLFNDMVLWITGLWRRFAQHNLHYRNGQRQSQVIIINTWFDFIVVPLIALISANFFGFFFLHTFQSLIAGETINFIFKFHRHMTTPTWMQFAVKFLKQLSLASLTFGILNFANILHIDNDVLHRLFFVTQFGIAQKSAN